jgi:hypothetical protein
MFGAFTFVRTANGSWHNTTCSSCRAREVAFGSCYRGSQDFFHPHKIIFQALHHHPSPNPIILGFVVLSSATPRQALQPTFNQTNESSAPNIAQSPRKHPRIRRKINARLPRFFPLSVTGSCELLTHGLTPYAIQPTRFRAQDLSAMASCTSNSPNVRTRRKETLHV